MYCRRLERPFVFQLFERPVLISEVSLDLSGRNLEVLFSLFIAIIPEMINLIYYLRRSAFLVVVVRTLMMIPRSDVE